MTAKDIIKMQKDIDSYIERLFFDAYRSYYQVDHPLMAKDYKFEYCIIQTLNGIWHFIPIAVVSRANKISDKVRCRLRRNIKKHFGLQYDDTPGFSYDVDRDFSTDPDVFADIDPSNTVAMFKLPDWQTVSLSIFDADNPHHGNRDKLICTYWDISPEVLQSLEVGDERRILPAEFSNNWYKFYELYKKTFNKEPGDDYPIICSSGIIRVFGEYVD